VADQRSPTVNVVATPPVRPGGGGGAPGGGGGGYWLARHPTNGGDGEDKMSKN